MDNGGNGRQWGGDYAKEELLGLGKGEKGSEIMLKFRAQMIRVMKEKEKI